MSTNEVVLPLDPVGAFALICDVALYPRWLVGAQSIRCIDGTWPAVGAKFEHRIGVGALAIPGSTTVRRCDAPEVLDLAAGMGLLGEALVRFELHPVSGGTEVRMVETPRRGIARLASMLMRPLVLIALWGRNHASLAELASLASSSPAVVAASTVRAGGEVTGADAVGVPLVEGPNSI